MKGYIYIVQASLEPAKCKIGKTNNLEKRLKQYNSMTGKSKDNIYQYLFACEAKNTNQIENAIKDKFKTLREEKSKEIYFYNTALFNDYVSFIKSRNSFIKETFIKDEDKKQVTKIVKKETPSLAERGLTWKAVLQQAKNVGNDEFYTRYEDIEKELSLYPKTIWKNKVVFCNCDDAVGDDENDTSAFALYFLKNFQVLKLKKLICTHYSGQVDLFHQGAKGYIFTRIGFKDFKDYPKGYTGSFDDSLSLKILNEDADIVCTNPPFSRAIDYWKVLIESGKKFLIISNFLNVITPAFIPYFKNNKARPGYNEVYWFLNPKKQIVRAAGHWYTNFAVQNRPKSKNIKFVPLKEIPDKYKKYDDKKILLTNNNYIPNDYQKIFAISVFPVLSGLLEMGYKIADDTEYFPYINGKRCFGRVLVQKK